MTELVLPDIHSVVAILQDKVKHKTFIKCFQDNLNSKLKIKLNDIDTGKLLCPTTFVTNWDVYRSIMVLLAINADFSLKINEGIINMPRNHLFVFRDVTSPSLVLSPLHDRTLYYVLLRSSIDEYVKPSLAKN